MAEAMGLLTKGMGQSSQSKSNNSLNPFFDFHSSQSTSCHDIMIRDFENEGIPQVFIIDLVGNHLDEVVASNDRCQV